jgi:hypothetical protein
MVRATQRGAPLEIALFNTVCSREGWTREGNSAVVTLPGGRHQRVTAEVSAEDGDEILRVRTHVGDAAVMNEARMLAALRMNARLRFGAIAIDGALVAMVDTLLLHTADPEALRQSILHLARKADELERGLFQGDSQ